ncbi:hypothetical protein AB0M11_26430 [Streptomyces sp. NPDC051987]|uniref:hypothetical protein n=1 Tax=Streptomyces sp. NPDC051987 TaxID=3155808 RepID=UPI00342D56D1
MATNPRQPAYDAVFAYIRQQPVDFLPATVVDRNAMIWRAVNAALDAVPSVPASLPDRAVLRDRIRRAVCEAEGFTWDSDMLEPDEYGEVADAVLAVLPSTGRAAVLREVADWLKVWRPEFFERWAVAEQDRYEGGVDDAADELRRLAAEPQQTQTETPSMRLGRRSMDALARKVTGEPDPYEATTGHLATCLTVAGGAADPDCGCAAAPVVPVEAAADNEGAEQ